jgi:transposase
MALYIRELESQEQKQLEVLLGQPETDLPVNRLLIVKLSAEGWRVPEISTMVNLHPINVRKWIHRFNVFGMDGLRSGKSPGRPVVFTAKQRQQIAEVAATNPRTLGLRFSRWSLQNLRRYLIEKKIVKHISVETVRQILQASQMQRYSHRTLQ